jgi:hypothetical protein
MSTLYLQRLLAALAAFAMTQASAAPVTVTSDLGRFVQSDKALRRHG